MKYLSKVKYEKYLTFSKLIKFNYSKNYVGSYIKDYLEILYLSLNAFKLLSGIY